MEGFVQQSIAVPPMGERTVISFRNAAGQVSIFLYSSLSATFNYYFRNGHLLEDYKLKKVNFSTKLIIKMKRNYIIKFISIIGVTFSMSFSSMAQKVTEAKLLGCWKLSRFEFLTPVDDSLALINGSKNYVSCFELNGKFTTKQKTKTAEKIIGTGTYKIDPDGKTIHQQRDVQDEGIDDPAEVIILTDQELAIKADNVIMHFERIHN